MLRQDRAAYRKTAADALTKVAQDPSFKEHAMNCARGPECLWRRQPSEQDSAGFGNFEAAASTGTGRSLAQFDESFE